MPKLFVGSCISLTSRCLLTPSFWVSRVSGHALSFILCGWASFFTCCLYGPAEYPPFLAAPSPWLEDGVCTCPPHALHDIYHILDSAVCDYLGMTHPDIFPVFV
ncbi:hypothetical protein B0H11DRAFT_1938688 [Mycena galericulata]|nr:hypothetical protein B0H11DRAFT_1938688 [Mycena galericulata]